MPIAVQCPGCGGKFLAPDEQAGTKVKCPDCAAAIEVGGTGQQQASLTGQREERPKLIEHPRTATPPHAAGTLPMQMPCAVARGSPAQSCQPIARNKMREPSPEPSPMICAISPRRKFAVAAAVVSLVLAAWFASVHFIMAPHVAVMRREIEQEEAERRVLLHNAGINETDTADKATVDKLFEAMMKDEHTYRLAMETVARRNERSKKIRDQLENVASPHSLRGLCVYLGSFVGTFGSPGRMRGAASFWPGAAEVVTLLGIAAFYWLRPGRRSA